MAARKSGIRIDAPLGIHELELALIREKAAWEDWQVPAALAELDFMSRIIGHIQWPKDFAPLVKSLVKEVAATQHVLNVRDTTRHAAAHTRLENAIYKLRDRLYL
ncbi:MAG: hypothetical protein HYR49_08490 [Gammaproteobacteria bacterium]|nr:hypothetical protein [Gammaproteobacteria bacterium]